MFKFRYNDLSQMFRFESTVNTHQRMGVKFVEDMKTVVSCDSVDQWRSFRDLKFDDLFVMSFKSLPKFPILKYEKAH